MDTHNYRRRLDRALERVKSFDMPKENKKAIGKMVFAILWRT